MKEFNIDDLSLESITLADASIENPEGISLIDEKQTILEFGLAFETLFNLEVEAVLVKLYVEIQCLNENSEPINIKGNFTTQFIFKVNGLNEYIDKKDDTNFNLETQLAISILNIAYSTSRGIIFTRSLGTVLGTVILPIISSQTLLKLSRKSLRKGSENIDSTGE